MSSVVLNMVLPHLLEFIAAAVLGLIGWAATAARARWGIEIEARHREALHSAIMSGIRAALGRGLTGAKAVEFATGYAESSVSDALRKLRPAPEVLQTIARAKLAEATATVGDR